MARIIFVTGTDTSVGKTVFTSLLLAWLAEKGASVFPLKLFCSGDRSDAEIFRSIVRNKW
ncbi:MAG: AAA family ATPase, partial [Verrucomicrobiales bacterium]